MYCRWTIENNRMERDLENIIRLLEGMAQDLQVAAERLRIINQEGTGLSPSTFKLDLIEKPDEYVALLDIPGITRDLIDLNASPQIIEVIANFDPKREKGDYLVHERPTTRQSRLINLPKKIRVNHVKAKYNEQAGVLRIRLPKEKGPSKTTKRKPKKIEEVVSS
jgi:HSP20 family molecular chaperone IbpA